MGNKASRDPRAEYDPACPRRRTISSSEDGETCADNSPNPVEIRETGISISKYYRDPLRDIRATAPATQSEPPPTFEEALGHPIRPATPPPAYALHDPLAQRATRARTASTASSRPAKRTRRDPRLVEVNILEDVRPRQQQFDANHGVGARNRSSGNVVTLHLTLPWQRRTQKDLTQSRRAR